MPLRAHQNTSGADYLIEDYEVNHTFDVYRWNGSSWDDYWRRSITQSRPLGRGTFGPCGVERSADALKCAKSLDSRGFSELMERGTKGIECDLIGRARGSRVRMGGLTLQISAARDHERRIAASRRQSHRRELGSRSSFPQVVF
jgi:hypothetical protein